MKRIFETPELEINTIEMEPITGYIGSGAPPMEGEG